MRSLTFLLCLLILAVATGCRRSAGPATGLQSSERTVAPGVTLRSFAEGDALTGPSSAAVLDIDLAAPGVRVRVAAENPAVSRGAVFADSYTVRDWCARTEALAGVNGGFFGVTNGDRKQVIGLLVTEGVVRSSGRLVRSRTQPDRRFVRCVLGFDESGLPRIGWAAAERGSRGRLAAFGQPLNPAGPAEWQVRSAVACGPRLMRRGGVAVTDREERLVSPPPLWRTFVGYSLEDGRPRRMALGIASQMTFQDVAAFLRRYFDRYHHTACAEAMCLDGGASSQLCYRDGEVYAEARPSFVSVPTAILVTTTKQARR